MGVPYTNTPMTRLKDSSNRVGVGEIRVGEFLYSPEASRTIAFVNSREVVTGCGHEAVSVLEVLGPAGGDVLGRVGVEPQVAVVGVAESSFQFGAVVAGGGGEPVGEGVAGIVGAQGAELALGAVDFQVVDPADLAHDGVDGAR